MPVRRTATVSITREQDTLLRACLATGRYRSVSEVMCSAMRMLDRDEAAALAAIRAPASGAAAGHD